MTVGISFTNGVEAVVIADARASGQGRESDSVEKLSVFSSDNYHGALFGSGDGNRITSILKNLNAYSGDTLESYVGDILSKYTKECDFFDNEIINESKKQILKRSSVFVNDESKSRFVEEEIRNFLNNFSEHKKSDKTNFILVGYDKKNGFIDQYYLQQDYVSKVSHYHLEIGSGRDGASLYLASKLPGVVVSDLQLNQLMFYAINAYSKATVNQGVGGTPKICMIDKNKSEVLSYNKCITLGNISGVYLAELNDKFTNKKILNLFDEIIYSEEISKNLFDDYDLNSDLMSSIYIPPSSWQEKANKEFSF